MNNYITSMGSVLKINTHQWIRGGLIIGSSNSEDGRTVNPLISCSYCCGGTVGREFRENMYYIWEESRIIFTTYIHFHTLKIYFCFLTCTMDGESIVIVQKSALSFQRKYSFGTSLIPIIVRIIFSDVITKYTRQHMLYVSESTITNIERNGCYFCKINEQAETKKPVKEWSLISPLCTILLECAWRFVKYGSRSYSGPSLTINKGFQLS